MFSSSSSPPRHERSLVVKCGQRIRSREGIFTDDDVDNHSKAAVGNGAELAHTTSVSWVLGSRRTELHFPPTSSALHVYFGASYTPRVMHAGVLLKASPLQTIRTSWSAPGEAWTQVGFEHGFGSFLMHVHTYFPTCQMRAHVTVLWNPLLGIDTPDCHGQRGLRAL